jgi:hypothetical protein
VNGPEGRARDVVAVDWSGAARGAAARIWSAHAHRGELVDLAGGRSREEVVDDLVARRLACPGGLTVGLDFSFALPQWFTLQHGCHCIDDVWDLVAAEGERWLAECAPPFWGRAGRPRPEMPEHLRRAEVLATSGGIAAKSTFQVNGAGSVGTGSLRGMPLLRRLHQGGFSIWPFHPASPFTVVEIYPRLLTGAVHKRDPVARASYLRRAPWTIAPDLAARMVASEDAFDAGISALVMARHGADLARLRPTQDPVTLLEGDIWRPRADGAAGADGAPNISV